MLNTAKNAEERYNVLKTSKECYRMLKRNVVGYKKNNTSEYNHCSEKLKIQIDSVEENISC